jgi:hypothetical protein
VNARRGVILAGIDLLIAVAGFYFYDAAGDAVTPGDVVWGLGRLFRDIDRSDIKLLQAAGLAGAAAGGLLLVGGLILMYRRND